MARCGRTDTDPGAGSRTASPAGPDTALTVTVTGTYGETLVAAVAGEIDLRTVQTLRTRLTELGREVTAGGPGRLVLDFSGVGFCDAGGLGALVGVRNDLRARDGEIGLVGVRPPQWRLFRLTGLDKVFPHYDTVAQAVAAGRTSSMS